MRVLVYCQRIKKVYTRITEKQRRALDNLLWDIDMDEATALRNALFEYLPRLENLARIVRERSGSGA